MTVYQFLYNIVLVVAIALVFLIAWVSALDLFRVHSRGPSVRLEELLPSVEVEKKEELNADTLQQVCASKKETDEAFCYGYLLGFVEGHEIPPGVQICRSDALQSADQAEKLFSNYMEDHPQYWKKARAYVLGAALQEAFPCSDF